MKWKATTVLFIWSFLILVINIPQVASNPIYVDGVERQESGYLFITENVSMPVANVLLRVDPFHSHTFELWGSYTLISNCNWSGVAAYVYPEGWHDSSRCRGDCILNITLNGESIEYESSRLSDVLEDLSQYPYYFQEIDDLCFAFFNLTLEKDNQTTLRVRGKSSLYIDYDTAFVFEYYFGSAYSWYGETFETIRLEVKDIQSFTRNGKVWDFDGFFPEQCLEVTKNDTWATATWNMIISSSLNYYNQTHLASYSVGFSGLYYIPWTTDTDTTPPPISSTSSETATHTLDIQTLGIVSAVSILAVIAIILIFARERS